MLTTTEIAARKMKQMLTKRGNGIGIRVGVRTTGCSGLAYMLEYIDTDDPSLVCFESNDVKIYVDRTHLPYLNGLTMDYQRHGLNEGFEFINPNERDRCGCGESFRI
jgi:iron-sulfur cluster assembly protein